MADSKPVATHAALIRRWGIEAFAGVISKPESHVRVMMARNSIPDAYWPAIAAAAPSAGFRDVTTEALLKMRLARFAEAS